MGREQKQNEVFKALKMFNNAVSTSRLYPENSPQVAKTIEKAYQAVKNCSRSHGEVAFGQTDDGPHLCGLEVPEKLQSEFTALLVYRHLNLLKLNHVVFWPTFDRAAFENILTAFISRKEAIDREGGGRPFVDGLGLDQFFPDEYQPPPARLEEDPVAPIDLAVEAGSVTNEILDNLFSKAEPQATVGAHELVMNDPGQAAGVIVAGIARVLKESGKRADKSSPFISSSYTRFLERAGGLIQDDKIAGTVAATNAILLANLNERMLALLCAQKYPEGFGRQLFRRLTEVLPSEQFDGMMRQLHRWVRQYVKQKTIHTTEARIVGLRLKGLLETPKGKQFLGREKARSLIQSGERERKEKRLETGMTSLLAGGRASLRNTEVLADLPSEIEKLIRNGRDKDVDRILALMCTEMKGDDDTIRSQLIGPLVSSGELLIQAERWEQLEGLSEALISWVRFSDNGDEFYKKALQQLQAIMNHAWERGKYARGDQILPVFNELRTGQRPKSPAVQKLVGLVQDRSYNRPFYQALLDRFLAGGGDIKAGPRLIMMGRPAGDFIIEKLLQEEEPANRLKIVDLLGDMGPVAMELILEKLPDPMPWYGKRNLLKLAGVMAGPDQVDALFPFLRHDDIRVQREAFVSIYTISGAQRKQALIKCLSESSEAMRSQVVKALIPYSDGETAEHLGVLLQDQEHYSEEIREPLVMETLKVLSRSGSVEGRAALQSFLDSSQKKPNRKLDESVWQAAGSALRQVDAALDEAAAAAPLKKGQDSKPSSGKAPAPSQTGKEEHHDEEAGDISKIAGVEEIKGLIKSDLDSAKEKLLDLIGEVAVKRRFGDAELLREWLVEIDPMALSEIIRAAEIIEEEKVASIAEIDIEAWSDLYDELSTEEFATFIHATERKIFNNEDMIFQQGDMQSGLYFINSGSVKVFYQDKSEEKLIKTALKGDILGADTVVDASVWTASAACLAQAEVMYLGGKELLKWRDEYPPLETKINDFCRKYASLQQFFNAGDKDRRTAERHVLTGRVTSVLLDDKWRDTGFSTHGDLGDVSSGGLSFFMRISQKKHARVLLGRNIRIMIPMEGAAGRQIDVYGSIIAVRSRQNAENEYSVHVKFNEDLTSANLQAIVKTNTE